MARKAKTDEVLVKSFAPKVSSHGYGDASIFFLNGYPTNDDVTYGASLSGYSETTLSSLLKPYKIPISQVYRSSFIKEKIDYAGTNPKKLKRAIEKIETSKYEELLFDELKSVNPNVIVPLDDIALAAVFPHINNIRKQKGRKYWVSCYRGSVLPLRQDYQQHLPQLIRVIPSLSPLILNQDWAAKAYTQIDFDRINKNKGARGPIPVYGLTTICKTYSDFYNFCNEGLNRPGFKFAILDVETYAGLITCASITFDAKTACSVPLSPFYYKEVSKTDMALNWQLFAKILANPKIIKGGQNFKYDVTMFERHGLQVEGWVYDTMLLAKILYPEFPAGLDFLTSIYTDIPYYKDEGKEFDPRKDSKDVLQTYNAKDSLATGVVLEGQLKELEEEPGLSRLYHQEIVPTLMIYKNIDEIGIRIDDDKRQRLVFKYASLYDQNLQILRGLVGHQDFNAKSPGQIGTLLYEELGFPKRTKTNEFGIKSYKTDKETLDDLLICNGENNKRGKLGLTIIKRVILCRKLAMVLVYLATGLHPLDNTFHGTSNLGGTETGRSSFSKSLDDIFLHDSDIILRRAAKKTYKIQQRLGRSLQTITKHGFRVDEDLFDDPDDANIAADIREMFVPRHGYVFIEGDGSQAEARMVAVLAQDFDLLASFDTKPKIHAKTASLCFKIDVNEITKDYPRHPLIGVAYYDLGKRLRHAGNYDMTIFRLAQMTHLPLSEAKKILDAFHETNPNIRGIFHKEVIDAIRRTRTLETPFERKRVFFDRFSDHLFKQAIADIPQSTISDQTKFSMWRLRDKLPGYGTLFNFLTEQHDGILSEVRNNYWEQFSSEFKAVYERPIDCRKGTLSRDFDLIIPCELSKSSENWKNLEEFKIA